MAKVQRTYYDSGELESEVFIINDKMHGDFKLYYENDSKLKTDSFGQIRVICSYIDGKKNGEYKEYYPNGKLYKNYLYINDKKNGEYKEYYMIEN